MNFLVKVFDGHGGLDAAAYIKRHAIKFIFEDTDFPQASEPDKVFLESMENCIRKAFLFADLALADDCTISSYSGTTVLTALVFGRCINNLDFSSPFFLPVAIILSLLSTQWCYVFLQSLECFTEFISVLYYR